MDKNFNDEILSDLREIRRSLNRTERNLAFLAWLAIIGVGLYLASILIPIGLAL